MDLELIDPERGFSDRLENICRIWVHYRPFYTITGSILLVLIGGVFGFLFAVSLGAERSLSDAISSLLPEAVGIAFTVIVIDRSYAFRQTQQLKKQLLREMTGSDYGLAMRALKEMRSNSWVQDGSLVGADLADAILTNANLTNADIRHSNLSRAKLKNSNLHMARLTASNLSYVDLSGSDMEKAVLERVNILQADLKQSYMWQANLSRAYLAQVDMQDAILVEADLHEAFLHGVDLRGANLSGANLTGAILRDVKLDKYTRLPNRAAFDPAVGLDQLTEFLDPEV